MMHPVEAIIINWKLEVLYDDNSVHSERAQRCYQNISSFIFSSAAHEITTNNLTSPSHDEHGHSLRLAAHMPKILRRLRRLFDGFSLCLCDSFLLKSRPGTPIERGENFAFICFQMGSSYLFAAPLFLWGAGALNKFVSSCLSH